MNVHVSMETHNHSLSKQQRAVVQLSSINIYECVIVMIHLAHNPADQHEQAHDNGHQALQNSKACSLLLFFGSDRVQLERVPGVPVQTVIVRGQNSE